MLSITLLDNAQNMRPFVTKFSQTKTEQDFQTSALFFRNST